MAADYALNNLTNFGSKAFEGGASAATGAATTAAQGGFGAFLGTAMPYLGFAAQLGLGLLNQDQQATEQRRQRDAANRQLKIQTHQENERRRLHNQREGQLAMVRERIKTQQLDFNRQAAQIAFAAEQQRLDDIFTRSGFASNQQKVMLMQAMGANQAANEGNRGRSYERASMISTMGNYGRMQAEKLEQLASERGQYERNLDKIAQQWKGANLKALANASIPPAPMSMLPQPQSLPMPSSGANMLNASALAIGALGTGYNLTAPGSSFFGIEKGFATT